MIKDIINNKKITRKEFLVSAVSIFAILFVGKLNNPLKKKEGINTYGNYSYGGSKKQNV